MAVRRDDGARPPDLDLALRHPVVVHAHVGVELARIRAYVGIGVVRHREDVLDADVPVGVLGRTLPEPEVGELVHRLEPLRLVQGALQLDLALLVIPALRQPDRHQPRLSLAVLRLDDEMRDALVERVDDDVRQLAVHPVGAADAIADLEAHLSLLSSPTARAESTSGRRGTVPPGSSWLVSVPAILPSTTPVAPASRAAGPRQSAFVRYARVCLFRNRA